MVEFLRGGARLQRTGDGWFLLLLFSPMFHVDVRTRALPAGGTSVHDPDEPRELTYVDIDTFESGFWADL